MRRKKQKKLKKKRGIGLTGHPDIYIHIHTYRGTGDRLCARIITHTVPAACVLCVKHISTRGSGVRQPAERPSFLSLPSSSSPSLPLRVLFFFSESPRLMSAHIRVRYYVNTPDIDRTLFYWKLVKAVKGLENFYYPSLVLDSRTY